MPTHLLAAWVLPTMISHPPRSQTWIKVVDWAGYSIWAWSPSPDTLSPIDAIFVSSVQKPSPDTSQYSYGSSSGIIKPRQYFLSVVLHSPRIGRLFLLCMHAVCPGQLHRQLARRSRISVFLYPKRRDFRVHQHRIWQSIRCLRLR